MDILQEYPLQELPQELDIPDFIRFGIKLLSLSQPLYIHLLKAINELRKYKATKKPVHDIMLSHDKSRQLAEGALTWEGHVKKPEFRIIVWDRFKAAGLDEDGIETLMEALPNTVWSHFHLCFNILTYSWEWQDFILEKSIILVAILVEKEPVHLV